MRFLFVWFFFFVFFPPAPLQHPALSGFYCPALSAPPARFLQSYGSVSQPHAAFMQVGAGARRSQRVPLRLPAARQRTFLLSVFFGTRLADRWVDLKRRVPRELIRAAFAWESMTRKSGNGSLRPKRKQRLEPWLAFQLCVCVFFSFPQMKTKAKNEGSVGLFTYPVLQAADILLYKWALHMRTLLLWLSWGRKLCCFHSDRPTYTLNFCPLCLI